MKKLPTIEEADILLEKYYEGTTCGEEEKLLQEFLQQENLPVRFEAERALFGYFAQEKRQLETVVEMEFDGITPPVSEGSNSKEKIPPRNIWLQMNPILKWTLAAAVLVFGVLILDNRIQAQKGAIAYIDGIRCTDKQEVTALAIASIDQLDLGSDEVAGTVEHMNDVNLVESQLQQFPELK